MYAISVVSFAGNNSSISVGSKSGFEVAPCLILVAGTRTNEDETGRYWLFDGDGNTLTKFDTSIYGVQLSRRFVFLFTLDEDFVFRIYALKRKGTEIKDLESIRLLPFSEKKDF